MKSKRIKPGHAQELTLGFHPKKLFGHLLIPSGPRADTRAPAGARARAQDAVRVSWCSQQRSVTASTDDVRDPAGRLFSGERGNNAFV